MRAYPHELSGGLRQRALIASALVTAPALIIADEPTTALDATVQQRILQLLRSIVDAGTGLVIITHDLAAAAHLADRIAVVQAGAIVECGPAARLLAAPQHAHTRELVDAWRVRPANRPERVDAPVLVAEGLTKTFAGAGRVVDDVSLTLHRGATLGVAGESGSGKTTLARLLMGIETPDAGAVRLGEMRWNPAPESARRPARRR
ncbi:MAG: ATP-binding cassette domain-containing protein, partial [Microthrixaceae bacterium]|nr:ATP-binding cassette domain-containing protein [Microthrixaceae bacterium]